MTLDKNGHKHASDGKYTTKERDEPTTGLSTNPLLAGLELDSRTRLQKILDEAEQNGHDVTGLREYFGEEVPDNTALWKVRGALQTVNEVQNIELIMGLGRDLARDYAPGADRIEIGYNSVHDQHGNRSYTPYFEGFVTADGTTVDFTELEEHVHDEDYDNFEEFKMAIESLDSEDPVIDEDRSGGPTRYFISLV